MPVVVRRRQAEAAEQVEVAPLWRTFILQVWRRRASFTEDERDFHDHEIERWFVCHSPLLALTVATTLGGELSPPMEQTAEPQNTDGASNQVDLGWTVTIRNDSYRDRASGLASLYALPFVNDKAAQLEHLAIQSYVSCLNVASCIILYFLLREHHAWLYILSINNLYTQQGSSTVWQFYNQ